jgi:HEAT repeats/PBS lyase HEAT-like repeat
LWPNFTTQPPPGPDHWARSALRDACTAQEAYNMDFGTYSEHIECLIGPDYYCLIPREGVAVWVISADKTRYRMVSFHEEGDKAFLVEGPGGEIQKISRKEAFSMTKKTGKIWQAKVKGLIKNLTNIDSRVRTESALELGYMGDIRAAEPLLQALGNKDENIRKKVVRALGFFKDGCTIEPLIYALKNDKISIRIEAVLALKRRRAIEPLIDALKDENSNVRVAAAEALGYLGDVRAIAPLGEASRNEDNEFVTRTITRSLDRLVKSDTTK